MRLTSAGEQQKRRYLEELRSHESPAALQGAEAGPAVELDHGDEQAPADDQRQSDWNQHDRQRQRRQADDGEDHRARHGQEPFGRDPVEVSHRAARPPSRSAIACTVADCVSSTANANRIVSSSSADDRTMPVEPEEARGV